ncbi:sensor histidine kinase [Marmoricola endophyticus]|uniref:sensor histidine kinase n=1 Tax=Marmoricola endophyticus TaxID=2040280 RepID=UPI00166541BC|nr:ATP-binding protein [Marmoricola endophyticus]
MLVAPGDDTASDPPLRVRRLVLQLAAGVIVALLVVTLGGSLASRRLAERESVNDAAAMADVLAEAVVQPSLTDALLDGDPAAVARFDRLVRTRVLGDGVVRLKIWSPEGSIVYSDQPDLIGRRFGLEEDERAVLDTPRTEAEISGLSRPENELDRRIGARLVEVYRPVWTAAGREALFEIYTPYNQVNRRTGQLWRGFAGVTVSTLLLFVVLVIPVVVHLLRRVRRSQQQRVVLLQRAVDASSAERRRIAGTLHDGPVQDLAATSFAVAGATARAQRSGQTALAKDLQQVSASVRTSIRAVRSLLVDIYPPSLARSGLAAALGDLTQSVRADDFKVALRLEQAAVDQLSTRQQRLVFRVAQETLRNAAKHAAPCSAHLTLARSGTGVVLEVSDTGPGFDLDRQRWSREPGHLGLQLLTDLVSGSGGTLAIATAPGAGTRWSLRLPEDVRAGDTDDDGDVESDPSSTGGDR